MNGNTTALSYRGDIDGLRAVAVSLVVLNHAHLGPFPGGYIGVDVFFVISGFLISGIIVSALNDNSFSLLNFYERRARRILPALVVVLLATAIAGSLVMTTGEMRTFGRTLQPSLFFYANIYMQRFGDYFGPATHTIPLLHLWSIAVEEQFYLAFPLLCWAVHRKARKHLVTILAVLAIISLVIATYRVAVAPQGAYYGTAERAWELLLGALTRLCPLPAAWVRRWGAALVAAGLVLIVVAAVGFDDATGTPGPFALVPSLGSALVLAAGGGAGWTGRLLTNAPMRAIGQSSYSIYLWHWPLFVCAAIAVGATPEPHVRVVLAALAVVIGMLSHAFIERPFRRLNGPLPTRRFLAGAGVGLVSVVAVSVGIRLSGGLRFRIPAEPTHLSAQIERDGSYIERYRARFEDQRLIPKLVGDGPARQRIGFVGDSHAGALSLAYVDPEAADAAPARPLRLDWLPGCPPTATPPPLPLRHHIQHINIARCH